MRQRETERDRETETDRDRQTGRQTEAFISSDVIQSDERQSSVGEMPHGGA